MSLEYFKDHIWYPIISVSGADSVFCGREDRISEFLNSDILKEINIPDFVLKKIMMGKSEFAELSSKKITSYGSKNHFGNRKYHSSGEFFHEVSIYRNKHELEDEKQFYEYWHFSNP